MAAIDSKKTPLQAVIRVKNSLASHEKKRLAAEKAGFLQKHRYRIADIKVNVLVRDQNDSQKSMVAEIQLLLAFMELKER